MGQAVARGRGVAWAIFFGKSFFFSLLALVQPRAAPAVRLHRSCQSRQGSFSGMRLKKLVSVASF